MKKDDEQRLLAFEMHCYRRTLPVKWQDHRTNEYIQINVKKLQKGDYPLAHRLNVNVLFSNITFL